MRRTSFLDYIDTNSCYIDVINFVNGTWYAHVIVSIVDDMHTPLVRVKEQPLI